MEKTNYGFFIKRNSRFIIVAPHAAGNDTLTKEMTCKIAEYLNGSAVVNEKYRKPTKSVSQKNTIEEREDFNRLPKWNSKKEQYLWTDKTPAMKDFYEMIKSLIKDVKLNVNKSAVVVYIHGMKNKRNIGIDIGIGARYDNGKLKGTGENSEQHPDSGKNKGMITASTEKIEKLKSKIEEQLISDLNLKVVIGKFFPGWSRRNGTQFRSGTQCDAIQLEISNKLRKSEKIDYTSKIISKSLKEVYFK
ncbi:MAG: hypothetical protein FJY07_08115 [Bacteroidetes bacterium]|nr:hypothetical protein [Bacteroidota bacterium]